MHATATQMSQYRSTEKLLDEEILANLFGGERGTGMARELLAAYGDLPTLGRVPPEDLVRLGLTPSKVTTLVAAIELGRRSLASRSERPAMRTSGDVFAFYRPRLCHLTHEVFHAMCLDSKHRLLRDQRVVEGGLTSCSVLPREAFSPAMRSCACAVIFVHNHPSGDPTPSTDDLQLTARLKQAGLVLGIKVLDHVIVGENRYVSLVDEGHFAAL